MSESTTVAGSDHCAVAGSRRASGGVPWPLHRRLRRRGLLWGGAAALLLFAGYVGVVAAANSLAHAIDQFLALWYWMAPLIAGFGLQAGLFVYARGAAGAGGPHASGVMGAGGTSVAAMAACCAHHVTDVLPLVGLAGAGLFLGTYQGLFLLLGVLSNAVGTVYLLSVLSRHGLHPAGRGLLAPLLSRSWRRAVPVALAAAVALMTAAVAAEFL